VPPRFGSVAAAAGLTTRAATAAIAVVTRKSRLENLLIIIPLLRVRRTGSRHASSVPAIYFDSSVE
jgi:hypothetical protein